MLAQLPSPKRPTIYQQSNLFKELQNKKHLTNVQRYSNNRAGTKIKTYLTDRNQNGRTPKSSILMGFSLINHSTIGVLSLLWKPPESSNMFKTFDQINQSPTLSHHTSRYGVLAKEVGKIRLQALEFHQVGWCQWQLLPMKINISSRKEDDLTSNNMGIYPIEMRSGLV